MCIWENLVKKRYYHFIHSPSYYFTKEWECHMKEICAEFQITGLWLWLQSRLESVFKKTCLNLWMVVFFHYFPGTMAQDNFSSSSLKGPFVIFFLYRIYNGRATTITDAMKTVRSSKTSLGCRIFETCSSCTWMCLHFCIYNGNKEAIMNGMIQSGWLQLSM